MYLNRPIQAYRCDLSYHFKIWLPQDPNIPLGFKNECRILDFLANNPHARLAIIIDKRLYSDLAHHRLARFRTMIEKHFPTYSDRLVFVDFSEIKQACQSSVEFQLIEIIENEIKQKYIGWPGLVSDIIRILTPACKLGIYSDFDISFFLHDHRSLSLPTNFAFRHIQTILKEKESGRPIETIYTLSNDILIFLDPDNNRILKKLQAFILANLQDPHNKRNASLNNHAISYFNFAEMRQIYIEGCSVVEYVINTTGPSALEDFLLRQFYSESFDRFFDEKTLSLKPGFLNLFNQLTWGLFAIANHFPPGSFSLNGASHFSLLNNPNNLGSDVSWIPTTEVAQCTRFEDEKQNGMKKLATAQHQLQAAEKQMKRAANTLSHFWKKRQTQLMSKNERHLAVSLKSS